MRISGFIESVCPSEAAGRNRSGQRFRRHRPREGQCGGPENAPRAAAQRGRGARGGLDRQDLSAWQVVEESKEVCVTRVTKGDWTDDAFRLGKAFRQGYKGWLSE